MQRLVYLVQYQVRRNVKCTNLRVQCDPAWEEFYAAQLQNFLHKVKMSQSASCLTENNHGTNHTNNASQRTTNHIATPLFCLSCYFGTLVFSSLNVVPLQSQSTLLLQEHYWIIHLWNSLKDYCVAHSYFRSSKQTGKQTAGESGIVRWCRWRWWRPVSTGPRGNRGGWCEMMKGPRGDRHPSVRLGHNLHKN